MKESGPEVNNILFYEQVLQVVTHNGVNYAVFKPLVEGMGLTWTGQANKIKNNSDNRFRCLSLPVESKNGKQVEMLCIPLDRLHFWLLSINAQKIKNEEVRNRIELYQRDCLDILNSEMGSSAFKLIETLCSGSENKQG